MTMTKGKNVEGLGKVLPAPQSCIMGACFCLAVLCWKTVSEGVISLDPALFPTATGTWHRRRQKV